MNTEIQNPILKGFHPDPSIIRVGEDYYIATSTFEWWPGARIHQSKDLVNWELITYPLTRTSQLDLKGVGASQGIWAHLTNGKVRYIILPLSMIEKVRIVYVMIRFIWQGMGRNLCSCKGI